MIIYFQHKLSKYSLLVQFRIFPLELVKFGKITISTAGDLPNKKYIYKKIKWYF